jgi:hypothetical protein
MFSREFTLADHSRRFTVAPADMGGWELRVMQDRDLVRRTYFSDWHRLERAMSAIEREMSQLIAEGWCLRDTGDGSPMSSHGRS